MSIGFAEYEWRSPSWLPPPQPTGFIDSRTEPVAIARPIVSPQSTTSAPRWAESVARRLMELSDLGRNWDNRGSGAVRRDALFFAFQMLWQTMPPGAPAPSVVPLGHGGVQLTWSNASAEVEVEVIQPNDVIIYYLDRVSGVDSEKRAETEFSELGVLLRTKFT
jgi:hypothetical protein